MTVKTGLWNALFVAILASFAATDLLSYALYISEWRLFHEELRSLFPYHKLTDPDLFEGDYIARYLESGPEIYGYDFINYLWTRAFSDLRPLHMQVLPIVLTTLFFAGLVLATYRIGGLVHAGCATVLAIVLGNILYRIGSPIPHAFAFPILAWTACALQYRSLAGLSLLTLLAAFFYPPITPVPAASLLWFMMITPRDLRGRAEQMGVRARLLVVGGVGVAAVLIALPALPSDYTEFGTAITPGERIDEFPENGPGGRYFRGTLEPVSYSFLSFFKQFAFVKDGDLAKNTGGLPLPLALAGIALVGAFVTFLLATTKRPEVRLLKPFVGAGLAVGLVLPFIMPVYTYRFIVYSMHMAFVLVFPLLMIRVLEKISADHRIRLILAAMVTAGFVVVTRGAAPGPMGKAAHTVSTGQSAAIEFAQSTPKDTVFAGWPGFTIDRIPYFAQRPALLLYKTHYPSHDLYTIEMRSRMLALVDALSATGSAPLKRLHEVWGVDYLVVERIWFTEERLAEASPPPAFTPFDERIEEAWRQNVATGLFLADPPAEAVVLDEASVFVLDLRRL